MLGLSYGGSLAQRYAVQYPDRVRALILVSSATNGHPLDLAPTRQYNYISHAEKQRMQAIRAEQGLTLAQIVFNNHVNGDWKRQHYYRPTREELVRLALYTLAQTMLDVPNTVCSIRLMVNSTASVAIPATKTVK